MQIHQERERRRWDPSAAPDSTTKELDMSAAKSVNADFTPDPFGLQQIIDDSQQQPGATPGSSNATPNQEHQPVPSASAAAHPNQHMATPLGGQPQQAHLSQAPMFATPFSQQHAMFMQHASPHMPVPYAVPNMVWQQQPQSAQPDYSMNSQQIGYMTRGGYIPHPGWQYSPLTMGSSTASGYSTQPILTQTPPGMVSFAAGPSVNTPEAHSASSGAATQSSGEPGTHGQRPPPPQFQPGARASRNSTPAPRMHAPGDIGLSADAIGVAVAQAIKLHSPTYGSTSTRAELDEKYERLSTDLLDETYQYVAATPVARQITFDGSPGHFSASKSTRSADDKLSAYQMASRDEATLYMSGKSIAAYEKGSGQTVLSVLRETNVKQQQMAVQQGRMPKCWGEFDSITGPSDETIEKALAVIDKKFDWLAVTAAACAGMLVIKIDADLNLEGKQCCIRYQCVTSEMLQFRFNPLSKYMNDYLRKHRTTHVFIPASVLVAQDLRIGQKLLENLHDQTRRDVTDKARSLAARQQNITDSSDPYITVPDILTATLRLGYRPDQDTPRKRELIKIFIERPKAFMTIDQLEAKFRRTENEYSALSGDKDAYHVGIIDKMDTWLEWIRDRTWAPYWIQETTRKKEWPSTIEEVFTMTRDMAQYEVTATEMANYAKLYPDANQISVIGARDARVSNAQGANLKNASKRPGAYTSKPYDRRGTVQRGAHPQALQNRVHPARSTSTAAAPVRRMLNRYERNTITVGKVTPEPGAKCPRCNKDRCRGRCWHCLKPETCADPPRGHTAKDCPFKDIGIGDVARWDPEWKKHEPHKPCFKCGTVGHPDHACPNPVGRRLLVRLVKDLDSGRWVNQMVAVCTLKEGVEQPDDDIIDRTRYDIHLTGESEFTACGPDTCGTAECGKGHAVDIAHIYRPEQKQKVANISTEDYINHVLQGNSDAANDSEQSEHERDEPEHCFDIAPVFDIFQPDDGDSELVALGKLLDEDDRTLWDTGAMRHLKRTVANAQGYIREPVAKLHGAQGIAIPSEGEATFETLHETDTGVPHTMLCDASICPQAPNITSAGAKFKEGYKAVHNMQGVFVPTKSSAYERVMRALNRHDLHLLFDENEHWVITPSHEKIRLYELKKNLFYLKRIEPTPVHETEHLKDMRQDPRYTAEQVSMIRARESITHDCELPHYVKEVQKIVGDYESLTRQVAHLGAFDEKFSDLMIELSTRFSA